MALQQLGHYVLGEKLGAGGMGEVYRGRDQKLQRDVAIKVLPAAYAGDRVLRARLLQEARAAAALSHPHICTIYEVGEWDDEQAYIVMELVEGQPLSTSIAGGPLSPLETVAYGVQLADALAHAHGRGVIHRDLKASNIMVADGGRLKILDFGLARRSSQDTVSSTDPTVHLTAAGAVMGTPAYMAPEVLRGVTADPRSDLWAAGVVLYEMVTGRLPFSGRSGTALVSAVLTEGFAPLSPSVPRSLRSVIVRCLEKEPERRWASAGELLIALNRCGAPAARRSSGPRPPRHRTSRKRSVKSVAVLPLENLSRDAGNDYFAEGMTEELIAQLSKLSALKVISRSSSMRYKRTTKSLTDVAGELGVDAIVEGSVLLVGQRVRVTAQLIHAGTDTHLWAESYDRALDDVLVLQSEVARDIVRCIHIAVTPDEVRRLSTAGKVHPAAHEAYLRGRHRWNNGDFEKAIAYFKEAIDHDPGYAAAWGGLGESYAELAEFTVMPPKDGFRLAEAAAANSLALDETVAEAHTAAGLVRLEYDRDWNGAERHFKRALELNPSYATGHQLYAYFLGAMLRREESLSHGMRAVELDPLAMFRNADLGLMYHMFGEHGRAIEQLRKTLEHDPAGDFAHWTLGLALVSERMPSEAIQHFMQAVEISGGTPMYVAGLGYGYAAAGEQDKARQLLAELEMRRRQQYVSPYFTAMVHTALGDFDGAFRLLDVAFEDRGNWMAYIRTQPELQPLRHDQRFHDLVRRLGFPREQGD